MTNLQYFLIRRVHSLLGVIPLGLFLFGHLTTNSMSAFGEEAFTHKVELIHSLGPLLPFIEAAVIFIPLALHIIIGIIIALTARNNVDTLGYGRNWAYAFQRWSGWVALAFILWHTITLRFLDTANIAEYGVPAFYRHLSVIFQNPLISGGYILGGLAVIYHFANGLCTFCMTWGITVSEQSQKVMAGIAIGVGLLLTSMLLASIGGFILRFDPIFLEPGYGLTPIK
ncbi:MAG: succinate dehydrogenase [Candidatus Sumerlaeia bacterium]|nr:succinate dehydrogenase [Candidatus Sumerlaeia bacterium]